MAMLTMTAEPATAIDGRPLPLAPAQVPTQQDLMLSLDLTLMHAFHRATASGESISQAITHLITNFIDGPYFLAPTIKATTPAAVEVGLNLVEDSGTPQ